MSKRTLLFYKVPWLWPYELLIIIILIWSWVSSTGTMIWTGRKNWIIQINTCPNATYSATDFKWTVPGLKPGLHVNLQYTWNSVLCYKKTVVSFRILWNISVRFFGKDGAFLNTYLRIYYNSFPLEKVYINNSKKTWLTKGIRISCQRKRELYVIYKHTTNPRIRNYYKTFSKILIEVIKTAKKLYFNKLIKHSTNKPKTLRKLVKP